MPTALRALLFWLVIFFVVILLWQMVDQGPSDSRPWVDETIFREHLDAGHVASVAVDEYGALWVDMVDGTQYATEVEFDTSLVEGLAARGIDVGVATAEYSGATWFLTWMPTMALVLVVLLAAALVVFLARRSGAGGPKNILMLRQSTAELLDDDAKATFADVGGCADAKVQLGDVIDYLRDPKPWVATGAHVPRGTLLEGPPGYGKTLLARALAGETGAKFYSVAASEFVEMFIGVGAARVRDLFRIAQKNAPAVVFIDELDAVGRRRGTGIGASHDEREQTLNQLLVCLDGLERTDGVVVLAATNRPDVLDPALLRPGRFDRRIELMPFGQAERREILAIHTRHQQLDDGVDLDRIAAETEGASGAELAGLANEAAVLAARRSVGSDTTATIGPADWQAALDQRSSRERTFDRLDMLLVESTSQLSETTGLVRLGATLVDGSRVEGEAVWADAHFVKIRDDDGRARVIGKRQIVVLDALAGTEAVRRDELSPDRLAGKIIDLA